MPDMVDLHTSVEHLQKKVLIIGNLNIDLIIRNVPDIPVWGQEVLGSDYHIFSSGQSAYTAFALTKLNVKTKIVSCVGDDEYGETILKDLSKSSIDITSIKKMINGKTGITVAIVRNDGERAFVSDPSSLASFNRSMAEDGMSELDSTSITCVLGSFFLPGFSMDDIQFCFEKSHKAGCQTLLDTGWDAGNWSSSTVGKLREVLAHVDYFMPNMDEALAITGEKNPEKAAEKILADGCGTAIIKLGEQGSYLRTNKTEVHSPAFKTSVYDAVGAGDVYNAGFIFGTLQEWPNEAKMSFGSALAAKYISKSSDRYPDFDCVIKAMKNNAKFNIEG